MIKRLYNITRATFNGFLLKAREKEPWQPPLDPVPEMENFSSAEFKSEIKTDPLAGYYANLEIPPGSNRNAVKRAWKQLMKKYHPDLHSADPEKRNTANEITRELTKAYRVLDQELSKKD